MSNYEYNVTMTCSGCSGAVERVLNRAKTNGSISDFKVDLDSQAVEVTPSSASYDDILAVIRKTGKAVNTGKDGEGREQAYTDLGKGKLESIPAPA